VLEFSQFLLRMSPIKYEYPDLSSINRGLEDAPVAHILTKVCVCVCVCVVFNRELQWFHFWKLASM